MPRQLRRRVHRRKIGGSFKKFMHGAKKFLKGSKLLSNIGNSLNTYVPNSMKGISKGILDYTKKSGYGRRRTGFVRRHRRRRIGRGSCHGGSLAPVGGSLAPVGGARRKTLGRMSPSLHRARLPKRMPAKF